MKQVTITVPDNCELKQDGNTYTIVEKEEKLTYEDVARKLFCNKKGFYISTCADIRSNDFSMISCKEANNCTSKNQARKLLAINKLMNLAKWLNDGWQPNWSKGNEFKYYIFYSNQCAKLKIDMVVSIQSNTVYFKSAELAKKAIEILGEDTIKLALCTDY